MTERKIVQIAATAETTAAYGMVVALCSDGTVWWSWLRPDSETWFVLPPIPQGNDAAPEPVCQCADVCVIPQGQPQPVASCRGFERQAIPEAVMARACQAVLAIIGVDDRVGVGQAVVSPATQQMAADIARAVIEAIS